MRDRSKTKEQLINELAEVRKQVTELKELETQYKWLQYDLAEGSKELKCLYSINDIVERPGITLDELYQEIVNLLPQAW